MISPTKIYEILVNLIMLWLSLSFHETNVSTSFFPPALLGLKDHDESKTIRLFCVILAIIYFSLILLLIL